jgi:hypothetical protein
LKHSILPSFWLVSSLIALLGMAQPASAQIIQETEPNDTFATANQTVGFNNLGFAGTLTLGDIDTFSMYIIPNSSGEISVAIGNVFWSAGNPTNPFTHWLLIDENENGVFSHGRSGLATNLGSGSFSYSPAVPTVFYFQVFSSSPDPAIGPVTGSTVAGDYSVTNIHGQNGTIVMGTAVPEPTGAALCLALSLCGIPLLRRRAKPRAQPKG